MKWLDYRRMRVSAIKLPGEIAARMKEPRVAALAASTDELGGEPMQAPTVNADTSPPTLVAGRDRMAATLLRKRKFVWDHVGVDWSPLELLKAEIHENLHRRHDDKAALTARLIDKAEAVVLGQASKNSEPTLGRPKSTRQEARELVAKASGESPDAIKKADQRAKTREERSDVAQGDPANRSVRHETKPAPIETNGKPLPVRMAIGLSQMIAEFGRLDHLMRQAQEMAGHFDMWSHPATERIVRALHDAAVLVRAERPTHLCPACDGESQDCATCVGRGWVTKATFESAPKESHEIVASYVAGLSEDTKAEILRGAFAPKKPRGARVVVNDRELTVAEADALLEGAPSMNSADGDVNEEDVPF